MELSSFLKDYLEQLGQANRVFVGFSGGLDSTVLLHSAVELLGAAKVCVLHANHQLQPDSDQWQKHCSDQSEVLGVEFRSAALVVSNQGLGIENEARLLRYEFFREHLDQGDILLLGHHLDDQAETLLYRLFRGAGVRGLSAIPEQRAEGRGQLLRPLLNVTRDQLRNGALDSRLEWIEDPSNSDIGYDRNYIRAEVLPKILERWPAAKNTLARASANLASAASLLEQYGVELLERCDWRQARWGWSLNLADFQELNPEAQALLLTTAFRELNLTGFDSNYLDQVQSLLASAEDRSPILQAGNSELRRFANRLYLMPPLAPFRWEGAGCDWDGNESIEIAGCGRLSATRPYQGDKLKVTHRKGGERCKPLDRDRSQSLKKLMLEYSLEPWLRDRTPLVCRDGEILAVAGLFSCSADLAAPELEWDLNLI